MEELVHFVDPPYVDPGSAEGTATWPQRAPVKGTVVLIRVHPKALWRQTAALVIKLQQRFATCPIGFWLDLIPAGRQLPGR
jgi:hypothetical protein